MWYAENAYKESPLFQVISNSFTPPGLWASEECSVSMPSICKRKKVWLIEKEKDIPKQHGTCPKGWLYINYKVNSFSKSCLCFSLVDILERNLKSRYGFEKPGVVHWTWNFFVTAFKRFEVFKVGAISWNKETALTPPFICILFLLTILHCAV